MKYIFIVFLMIGGLDADKLVTLPAKTLEQWKLYIGWGLQLNIAEKEYTPTGGKQKIDNNKQFNRLYNLYEFRLGVLDSMEFDLTFPIVISSYGVIGSSMQAGGSIGDMEMKIRYAAFSSNMFRITPAFGIKLPTGNYAESIINTDRTGTGSFDVFTGSYFTLVIGNFSSHINILYFFTMPRNNNTIDDGNIFTLIFSSELKVFSNNKIILDFSFKNVNRRKENGMKIDNTDYYILQLKPSMELKITNNIFVEVGGGVSLKGRNYYDFNVLFVNLQYNFL